MIRYPGITIFCGGFGVGKTLSAVILARYYYYNRKSEVYSNFELNISHHTIRCLEDLKKARGGLMILDEAYMVADARRSQSNLNLAINEIVAHSRKRSFDVIIIAQLFDSVDKRLRNLASRLILPQITEWNDGKPAQMRWRIFQRSYNKTPSESGDVWREVERLVLPINGKILNSYSTTASIYDFTAVGAFKQKLLKGKEFERYVAAAVRKWEGWDVVEHDGKDADHPGFYDHSYVSWNNKRRIEADCVSISKTGMLYTDNKDFDEMLNALIVFMNPNNGELTGFFVKDARPRLNSKMRTHIGYVTDVMRPLKEILEAEVKGDSGIALPKVEKESDSGSSALM